MSQHCPHCGQHSSIPMLFSITRQRIFNFIWHNPGCDNQTICRNVWGRPADQLLCSHIAQMRKVLDHTRYRIVLKDHLYRIAILPGKSKPQSVANVSP